MTGFFFRSCIAAALGTVVTACSSPLERNGLPSSSTAVAQSPSDGNAAARHLYVIVTTSTRFVAEYPIRGGIPAQQPDRIVRGFAAPNALFVDGAGHLYVLDLKTIKEFAPGASGNARPIREIDLTSFLNIDTLAVDARGYLYVGQKSRVYVYGPGAHGRASPVAKFKPTGYPAGFAVDSGGNFYAQGNTQETNPDLTFQTHASVYSAAPNLQLRRQFCSYEMTAHGIDYGIALDGAEHIFTTHTYFVGSDPHGQVDVFPQNADRCPIGPIAKITTTNPALREPVYLAIAAPYLYVGDVFYGNGGVVFTLRTSGSPQQPLSTLNVGAGQPHNVFGIALGP